MWDRRRRLWPAPIVGAVGDRWLAGMPVEERLASWHLVEAGGRVSSAGAGLAEVLSYVPGGGLVGAAAAAGAGGDRAGRTDSSPTTAPGSRGSCRDGRCGGRPRGWSGGRAARRPRGLDRRPRGRAGQLRWVGVRGREPPARAVRGARSCAPGAWRLRRYSRRQAPRSRPAASQASRLPHPPQLTFAGAALTHGARGPGRRRGRRPRLPARAAAPGRRRRSRPAGRGGRGARWRRLGRRRSRPAG